MIQIGGIQIGILDNTKANRQSFARASLRGNELDADDYSNLDDNILYRIDYQKYYNTTEKKIFYNKEEIRYWCYGYYLAKMQFSAYQTISLGMQFFNRPEVVTFDSISYTSDLPWRMDALLDGYAGCYSDKGLEGVISVPYIDMYQLYTRVAGSYEFDIMWDLNDFTIDAFLFIVTDGGYGMGKTGAQTIVKFSTGAAIDVTLQIGLMRLKGISLDVAYSKVDWSSAVYSGVENFHSSWIIASTMSCLRNALKEMGNEEYDYKEIGSSCLYTFLFNALSHEIVLKNGRFSKLIKNCLTSKALETIRSFKSIGLDRDLTEWVISKVLTEATKEQKKKIDEAIKNTF